MNVAPLLNVIAPKFRLEDVESYEHHRGWMMAGKVYHGAQLLFTYHDRGDGSEPSVYWGDGGEKQVATLFAELDIASLVREVYREHDTPAEVRDVTENPDLSLQISTVFECLIDHFYPVSE